MGNKQSSEKKVETPKTNIPVTQVPKNTPQKADQSKPQTSMQTQSLKTVQPVMTSEPKKPVHVSSIPTEEIKKTVVQVTPVIEKKEACQSVQPLTHEETHCVQPKEDVGIALNKIEAQNEPVELIVNDAKSAMIQPIVHKIGPDSIPPESLQLPSTHVETTPQTVLQAPEEPIDTTPTMTNAEAVKQPIHHHVHPVPLTVHENVVGTETKKTEVKEAKVEEEKKVEEAKVELEEKLAKEEVKVEEVKKTETEQAEHLQPDSVMASAERLLPSEEQVLITQEAESVKEETPTHQVITEPVTIQSQIEPKEAICGINKESYGPDNSTPEDKAVLNKVTPVVVEHVQEEVDVKEVHQETPTPQPETPKEASEHIQVESVQETPKIEELKQTLSTHHNSKWPDLLSTAKHTRVHSHKNIYSLKK